MLVEFAGKIIFLARKWRWFAKFVESTLRGKVIFIGIGLSFFALSTQIFQIFGLFMLYFPRLCMCLILACLIIPLIVIFSVPFMGTTIYEGEKYLDKKSSEICILGILIVAFGLYFMLGLGFFIGWDWIPKKLRAHVITEGTQFPLSNVTAFDIDARGYIYTGSQTYSRVQVYTPESEFSKGWFVPAYGGIFSMWTEGTDLLHVVTARKESYVIYDSEGKVIYNKKILSPEEYLRLRQKGVGLTKKQFKGDVYSMQNPTWHPTIIRVTPEGDKKIVAGNPLYYVLYQKTVPHMLVTVAFIFLCMILGVIIMFNVNFNLSLPKTLSENKIAI